MVGTNWVHLRVHENEFYPLTDICDYLLSHTRTAFIVQHDADEDVNRLHIHATLCLSVKYNTFKNNHLKTRFPKLVGKTHFGGHDIKDFEANNRYCCKGKEFKDSDNLSDCFILLKRKGQHHFTDEYLINKHREYWVENKRILDLHSKNSKQRQKAKTWALDLAERLKSDKHPYHNDLVTKVIVYKAMMTEMSKDARKLGANNFKEIHLGIMNYLCPEEIERDGNWLQQIFPYEDQYELQRMMNQRYMEEYVLARNS